MSIPQPRVAMFAPGPCLRPLWPLAMPTRCTRHALVACSASKPCHCCDYLLAQELNPLPFVGIFANCTAWLLYGTLTKDPYVYFSNILGLPLGVFYVFTTMKYACEKVGGNSGFLMGLKEVPP